VGSAPHAAGGIAPGYQAVALLPHAVDFGQQALPATTFTGAGEVESAHSTVAMLTVRVCFDPESVHNMIQVQAAF
jgi:hypothetical protein